MKSLKAKLALLLFALAMLAAIPVPLHADGLPMPTCDKTGNCVPPGSN